jgi:natural product biosynthesis luciferase-like monooxygenase protein
MTSEVLRRTAERSAAEPRTLVELLRCRSDEHGDRLLFTFLGDDEQESENWSYRALDRAARQIAARLRSEQLADARVVIAGPTCGDYVAAFFGCQYAGAVAVPWRPGFHERDVAALHAVIEDCQASAVLVCGRHASKLERVGAAGLRLEIPWIDVAQCLSVSAQTWTDPEIPADAVAYLQYTSGSIADPKGVVIRHRNVLANERMIRTAFTQDERSIVVGWLPFHHDMGLVGTLLQPLYSGGRGVYLSPAAFLQRPVRWLRTISRYRATTSGAPDFAYDLCARKVTAEDKAGLDLRCWTLAFNGSEPVRAETLDRFTVAFAPCGFSSSAWMPCYGLAEATLLVACDRVDAREFTAVGRAEPSTGPSVVSCGRSAAEQTVVIVEPASDAPVPDGTVGEIAVAGPSVASEYWNNAEATERTFRTAPSRGGAAALHTGDLGFIRNGRLYVTGRLKDLLIIRGVNHHPADIEHTAGRSHPRAVPGATAAFALESTARERLVVVQEVNRGQAAELADTGAAIRRAVLRDHGVSVDDVVLVGRGGVPKTGSGKIRRRACRSAWCSAEIEVLFHSTLPLASASDVESIPWEAAAAAGPERDRLARHYVRCRVAAVLGIDEGDVDADRPLAELGLDSMKALELQGWVATDTGLAVDATEWLGDLSIQTLSARLVQRLEQPAALRFPLIPAGIDEGAECPLSAAQRAIWYVERLSAGKSPFNIASAARIEGQIDAGRLRMCFQMLVDRHAALRTTIVDRQGAPVGMVHPGGVVDFEAFELTQLPSSLDVFLDAEASRPFDVSADRLLRVRLIGTDTVQPVLLIVVHHLVADLWSLGIVMRELGELLGGGMLPPAPRLTTGSFARWESAVLSSDAGDSMLRDWRADLTPVPPPLVLPFDRPPRHVQSFNGDTRPFHIPADAIDPLATFARRRGATLFIALATALETLMYRYTDQTDFLIGTPAAGRSDRAWQDVVGCFVNPIPIRARIDRGMTYAALLDRARSATAGGLTRQAFPFSHLAEQLHDARDRSRPPLFQVMLSLQSLPSVAPDGLGAFAANVDGARMRLGGLAWQSIGLARTTSEFDLAFVCAETDDGLRGTIQFNSDAVDVATAEQLARDFCRLIAVFARSPHRDIEVPLLTAEEEAALLAANPNGEEYLVESVHRAFERVAEGMPSARAVVFEDRVLTFDELNRCANRIARRLLDGERASVVGIVLDRCAELPAAMLAAMKCGRAYVPLDPAMPTERLRQTLRDAGVSTIVTSRRIASELGPSGAAAIFVDDPVRGETDNLDVSVRPEAVAYHMYTSGSTGVPKGVMVSHRNLANLFAAMDRVVGCGPNDVMLAVTGITFDISILELLWTLTRGCMVVITSVPTAIARRRRRAPGTRPVDFSLFYFAQDTHRASGSDAYRLMLEGAAFADTHGFAAVWTPERHFDPFGGLYPNPSITAAALAMTTRRVAIRAGSVVLPLHHPIRVAEDWAVVDNLSNGRTAIAFASGWHADDFAIAPDHYQSRKSIMVEGIETVRRLWRGEAVTVRGGAGHDVSVRIYPRPVQPELPVWITAAGADETFRLAGSIGANVLTHLLGQSVEGLSSHVASYRAARAASGFDPDAGIVTLMAHTFIGDDVEEVRRVVREPMIRYLRGAVGLVSRFARSLDLQFDPDTMSRQDQDALLEHAFERYFQGSSLLGSKESCRPVLDGLADGGVNEVACLVDFGVDEGAVLESLPRLDALRAGVQSPSGRSLAADYGFAAQAARYRPTLMQSTPSSLQMLVADAEARTSLASVEKLLVGGEAMPSGLPDTLRTLTGARLFNMYGPTETTVWSATHEIRDAHAPVPIGRPIANTQIYVVDRAEHHAPCGVVGEVLIGGDGVALGYKDRRGLTAERFVPDPFSREPGRRLYRTGDLGRRRRDGAFEWVGRADFQVKIRGHRVELGEIEAALLRSPDVREAAIVVPAGRPANELIAYVVSQSEALDERAVKEDLRTQLPEHMIPRDVVRVTELPRTSNGKLDRRALASRRVEARQTRASSHARTDLERRILDVWRAVLGREDIGIDDNFFDVGGHSLLMAQAHSELQTRLSREWPLVRMLEFPTVADLARHLGDDTPEDRLADAAAQSHARRAALLKRRAAVSAATMTVSSDSRPLDRTP